MRQAIAELVRGEATYARALLVVGLVAIYVFASGGDLDWDTLVLFLTPVVQAVITRPAVTPAVNPQVPTTIAVKQDNGETPAELPPMQLPPVRTLTGDRR